nr:MAG TPA: tail assembly chaperone protein [Caudoviricetes sp.]
MISIKSFLKKNKKKTENIKLKLESFDEHIELRIISGREYDAIQDKCYVNKPGRKGRQERVLDMSKFNNLLCSASVVVPDLQNAELQESYGVRGEQDLYGEMFTFADHLKILEAISNASGLDNFDDLVDEAKN